MTSIFVFAYLNNTSGNMLFRQQMICACLLANVRHSSIVCLNNTCRIVDMRCLNTKIGGIDVSETDEPQGFEHTHNILNINQNSKSLMTFITSKLKSKLKQHIIIARGKKRIDYRLSYNFYTTYYDNVEIKKIDCEYTYAMPIAILIRHTMSFDNARFFAQLRHPVL
ncbi:TPA: hypothetical protein O9L84_000694 [Staphylococcus aureus]|uniref:hypothetical protein n=1 Tax=Staphylococcus aureus TaxID=1280 RepID=UPI00098FE684|nr:hypothetical protein [Staphylococcus aureus]MBD6608560.1 hypothetical protein [Staphylococcus aureus]MBD6764763.1 hypothetical protein [Staphylococcus aureus]MBO8746128.1 hypothetical protein [Staphylococcus aureus]MCB8347409.1 hypothetical protein [Staphylococcus aureus]MCC0872127.1 hypothetical protein [Staphylococcus aureus]